MNLILFGPPGAGKGTQARLIKDRHHLILIATGDILREEIKKQSPVGRHVEETMAKGLFPSDDIILEIFESFVEKAKGKDVVLDGLPRTLNQAQKIDQIFRRLGRTLDLVIQMTVDDEELIRRLSSRLICKKCGMPCARGDSPCPQHICNCSGQEFVRRPDDEPGAIKTRLEVYNTQTKPLIDYYSKQGIVKVVDGMKSIEEVNTQIEALLGQRKC